MKHDQIIKNEYYGESDSKKFKSERINAFNKSFTEVGEFPLLITRIFNALFDIQNDMDGIQNKIFKD